MALTEKLTNIANAIREKTGKTDRLTLAQMPSEIASIQAGGGESTLKKLLSATMNMSYYFQQTILTSLVGLIAYDDTTDVTNMTSLCNKAKSLVAVPLFDTRKVTKTEQMFSECTALKIVPAYDFRSVSGNNFNKIFYSNSALEECWIKNISANLTVGSGDTYGHLLTYNSLIHLIGELRNTGASKTFTVGSANLAKLANVYVKPIEITDEMRAEDDLIDEKSPFEVCASTDEGAMFYQDYLALKNWSIA